MKSYDVFLGGDDLPSYMTFWLEYPRKGHQVQVTINTNCTITEEHVSLMRVLFLLDVLKPEGML